MLKQQVGPYKKPKGLLLANPAKRIAPKSKFLRAIEKRVRQNIAFEQKVAAANAARAQDALDAAEEYVTDYYSAALASPRPAPSPAPPWVLSKVAC